MSYAVSRADTLDYQPYRIGTSKLVFRGPQKPTDTPYVAILGGTEVYGRFIVRPFPDLLEQDCKLPVLNLGFQNAGIDAFLYDPEVMNIAKGAKLTVIHVMGAPNMSNRYYRVHPRRNDRFLGPSAALRALYPEIDFTDFSFTKHMMSTLNMVCVRRFAQVREELQIAWSARMQLLLKTIDGPVLLLWLKDMQPRGLGAEPLFVGADMVADISERCLGMVQVPVTRAQSDLTGMVYGPMDGAIAGEMLGVDAHQKIAQSLAARVAQYL